MWGVRVEAALALMPGLLPMPPTPSAGEGGRLFVSFPLLFGSLELTKMSMGVCSSVREGAGNTHPEPGFAGCKWSPGGLEARSWPPSDVSKPGSGGQSNTGCFRGPQASLGLLDLAGKR